MTMWPQNMKAVSVGGGKGGIGKSCFAANFAISLALQGKQVVLVDTDIEAANLHTFVGVSYPRKTLDDYFAAPQMLLSEIVLDTPVPGLRLVSSAGSGMSLGGLKFTQRQRLFRSVARLDAEVVVFDVAAGTNTRIIDYFSLAPTMVIMIEPIPTSLENAFVFLKNLMYRHLLRMFFTDKTATQMITGLMSTRQASAAQSLDVLLNELGSRSPERTQQFRKFVASLDRVYLVINKVRNNEQLAVVDRFARVVRRYLLLNLRYGGGLPYEPDMDASIVARTPFIMQHPGGKYAQQMEKIIDNVFVEE